MRINMENFYPKECYNINMDITKANKREYDYQFEIKQQSIQMVHEKIFRR